MSESRAQRIERIFLEVVELPPGEQRAQVTRMSDGDGEIEAEVIALLDADASHPPGFMESPVMVGHGKEPSLIGTVLDARYRIVRLIGHGGMGVVYEAEQEHPTRRVAVKLLRAGWERQALSRRFEHEVELLGRLRHPGIAQVFDAGSAELGDGTVSPYFVMELVEGRGLLAHCDEHGLGIRERLELVASICDAVQHAHQRGVIHRDLKPENILVDQGGRARILDFGIARAIDGEQMTLTLESGQILGSLSSMSPEQISGQGEVVDTRTDIYAIGVIMYRLLGGRAPVEVEDCTIAEAVRRINEMEPLPLGRITRTLSGDIETICACALDKDKNRRYASASEMAGDIRRFLNDQPIHARPASTLYHLSKFARRHRSIVGGSLIALLALIAMVIGMTTAWVETSRQRDLALASLADADAASEFFKRLLYEAYPESGRRAVPLREFLDAATHQLDEGVLRDRPRVEAQVRVPVGVSLRLLGSLEESAQTIRPAIRLARTQGDDKTLGDALQAMASVEFTLGNLKEAERLVHESMDAYRRAGLADSAMMAAVIDLLAQIRQEGDYPQEAIALAEQALAIREQLPNRVDERIARSHQTLGVAYRRIGNLERAKEHAQAALDIYTRLFGDRHPLVAEVTNNLAIAHLYANEFEQAEPLLLQVLEIRKELFDADHPSIATTLNALGGVAYLAGRHDEALDRYREALRIRLLATGPDSGPVALCRYNIAQQLLILNRPAESEKEAREALRLYEMLSGMNARTTGETLNLLAMSLLAQNRPEESLRQARRAESIFEYLDGSDSDSTAFAQALQARALHVMGQVDAVESMLIDAHRVHADLVTSQPIRNHRLALIEGWLADYYETVGNADEAARWRAPDRQQTTDPVPSSVPRETP